MLLENIGLIFKIITPDNFYVNEENIFLNYSIVLELLNE